MGAWWMLSQRRRKKGPPKPPPPTLPTTPTPPQPPAAPAPPCRPLPEITQRSTSNRNILLTPTTPCQPLKHPAAAAPPAAPIFAPLPPPLPLPLFHNTAEEEWTESEVGWGDDPHWRFMASCGNGRVNEVLRYKGDVNQVLPNRDTPLTAAACREQNQVLYVLVAHRGANPRIKDGHGELPLQLAVQNDYLNTVRLLVQFLGAQLEQPDKRGTALMAAESPRMIQLLISELGADPNLPLGATPSEFVCSDRELSAWSRAAWETGSEADLTRPVWSLSDGSGEAQSWLDLHAGPSAEPCL